MPFHKKPYQPIHMGSGTNFLGDIRPKLLWGPGNTSVAFRYQRHVKKYKHCVVLQHKKRGIQDNSDNKMREDGKREREIDTSTDEIQQ
ncbi:hypothetical protein CEXT_633801 [Caerostris extrusa]|uniref:Ycf1 n=1 Tax=Caerostris extrusa TaxID=172846 RepID=A0AAV4UNW0_CAEEX|nr:hypothetical protein CEXT_633801 [Caerostris extrusa]